MSNEWTLLPVFIVAQTKKKLATGIMAGCLIGYYEIIRLQEMTTEKLKSKRSSPRFSFARLLRFRIRTLLIVVALFGIFVGPALYQQSRQNEAIDAIRDHPSTWLAFAHEVGDSTEWQGRLPLIRTSLTRNLARIFKTDYFDIAVRLYRNADSQTTVNQIGYLNHLVWLQVGTNKGNLEKPGTEMPSLTPIANCSNLQYLVLGEWFRLMPQGSANDRGTGVTLLPYDLDENDIDTIAKIKKLRVLTIGGRGVSDESIKKLAALKNLQYLYLSRTSVSDRGIASLRELLPNVTIVDMNDSDHDYSDEVAARF